MFVVPKVPKVYDIGPRKYGTTEAERYRSGNICRVTGTLKYNALLVFKIMEVFTTTGVFASASEQWVPFHRSYCYIENVSVG